MAVSYLNDEFFARLETLSLNLRTNLAGFFGGKHLVKTYGQTVEFSDYREYMLGDDIRRIDWNLYSRFEKHFLKLFTDERQMKVSIFLDCSASMGKDQPQKSAYAVGVAGALGFLAVHNMDKVSFRLMKGAKSDDPFGTIVGKQSFYTAIKKLDSLEFSGETDIGAAVTSCVDMGTNDGLAVIISDFFTESSWQKAVDYLTYKKQQVLLIQTLTPEEVDPVYDGRVHLIDSESADIDDTKNLKLRMTRDALHAYQMALQENFDELTAFCNSREAGFIRVTTDKPIEKMLFGELLKVGVMS